MKLINDDALKVMQNLIDKGVKVDCVVTDPPYGITNSEWDKTFEWERMWELLLKVTKPNAPIILFGAEPYTSDLVVSNIKMFKEKLIWLKNKSGTGLHAKTKHIKVTEDIVVFCKENKYTYNPQKWLVEEKEFLTQRKTFNEVKQQSSVYTDALRKQKGDDGSRYPLNIISCRVPFTPSKTKKYDKSVDLRYHPNQKPIKLMEYLVKTYTNKGELVLDFTMGSGTTGIACKRLGRDFIGIELDEKYFEIAKERIEND